MENVVFLELKRREKEVFYNKEGKECDFLIREKERITNAIQVTVSLEEETTRKREISGLAYAINKYDLSGGTILTMNDEPDTISGYQHILILPLWKWLLGTNPIKL